MSLELDDETRALLGYARSETTTEDEQSLRQNRMQPVHERDAGFAERIDGRHRRNWRRRREPARGSGAAKGVHVLGRGP